MAKVFTVPFVGLSLTTDSDQDIFEAVGASGYPFDLLAFELYSAYTTDERISLRLVSRSTTGSGGSAATEVKMDPSQGTIQTAVSTLVTTPGTLGSVYHGFYWSQLSPLIYRPTPDEVITTASGGRICLNVQSAVGSSRTISGFVTLKEYG